MRRGAAFVMFRLAVADVVERLKRHSCGGLEGLYDVAERHNSISSCTFRYPGRVERCCVFALSARKKPI